MKSLRSYFLTFISFIFFLQGCNFLGSYEKGNGKEISVTRKLQPFDHIRIGGNFEVNLLKGAEEKIIIDADENLESLIETKVEGQELQITTPKKLISARKIRLTITYNQIREITAYGATLLRNDELLESPDLKLNLEGAGVIDLQLKVSELDAQLSGAGLVKLNGYATHAVIRLSGAGGLDAYGLETESCDIDVSGIGGAKIHVKNRLKASIEGVGGIDYKGHPASVDKNVSGIGTIKEVEDNEDHT